MNSVNLTGRLTRDPELRTTQSGTSTTSFTLAVDKGFGKEQKAEMQSEGRPTADFVRVVAWGKLAETVATYTNKGKLVAVQGRINTGSYEDKDGKKVFTTDVVAQSVEFLEFDKQAEIPEGFEETKENVPW